MNGTCNAVVYDMNLQRAPRSTTWMRCLGTGNVVPAASFEAVDGLPCPECGRIVSAKKAEVSFRLVSTMEVYVPGLGWCVHSRKEAKL